MMHILLSLAPVRNHHTIKYGSFARFASSSNCTTICVPNKREKNSTASAFAEFEFISKGAIGKTVGLSYKPKAVI